MTSSKAALYREHIVHLNGELASIDRNWASRHKLLLSCILALPAAFVHWAYAVLVVFLGVSLYFTQSYLLTVRRKECVDRISAAQEELARFEAMRAT